MLKPKVWNFEYCKFSKSKPVECQLASAFSN